jgi:hypothetical protein
VGAPLANRVETGAPSGVPIMKFTLTYEGELSSNGRPAKKWEIRQYLHPQLVELWRVNPVLKMAERERIIPSRGPFHYIDQHHSYDAERPLDVSRIMPSDVMDLGAPIERGGRKFLPLVRESFALNCLLKITFLRKEEPGRVYQGGDMDNRLKTLFDALAVPSADQMINDGGNPAEPIYCVLEDDRLITGFGVDTHRLLTRPGVPESHVQLLIEVEVRLTQARSYNQFFLGG